MKFSSIFSAFAFFATLSFTYALHAQPERQQAFQLRVMSYNVHHCNPPGTDKIDVDLIAKVIREQKPDLAAIQEIDVFTNRSGKINQAKLLAEKSGLKHYYFAKAIDYNEGEYGVLILSRFPLSDTITYRLPSAAPEKDEARVMAAATVTLPGNKTIRFASTHLEAYNAESRRMQASEINRIAADTPLPFILAGDMNAEEKSDVIRLLDQKFLRTCTNCENTFGEDGETGAIDYILYRPGAAFHLTSHQVIPNHTASDHMPVLSVLLY